MKQSGGRKTFARLAAFARTSLGSGRKSVFFQGRLMVGTPLFPESERVRFLPLELRIVVFLTYEKRAVRVGGGARRVSRPPISRPIRIRTPSCVVANYEGASPRR